MDAADTEVFAAGILQVKSSAVTSAIHYPGYLMILVLLLIKLVITAVLYGGSHGGSGALPKAANTLSSVAGC